MGRLPEELHKPYRLSEAGNRFAQRAIIVAPLILAAIMLIGDKVTECIKDRATSSTHHGASSKALEATKKYEGGKQ